MGGTSSNGNGGELGSESIPSPLDAKPLSQLGGVTQSTVETSNTHQQTMVGVVGSPVGTHKTRSLVWTHFVKLVINGEQKAKCMYCHRLFSGKSKNGTSHLREHMYRRCPRRFGRVVARQKLLTFNRSREERIAVQVVENRSLDGRVGEGLLSSHDGLECGVGKSMGIDTMRSIGQEPKAVIECQSGLGSGVGKSMGTNTMRSISQEPKAVIECQSGLGCGVGKSMTPDIGQEPKAVIECHSGLECGVAEKSLMIVQEPKLVVKCQSDGHEHSPVCVDGGSQLSEPECGSLSNVVIKANYKEDTVRFDFPLPSNVDQLEKEVAKNLKLALNSFKMKYQDEDKEWMLMTMDSHLSYALNLSKSSGSNVIRLLVSDM